MMPALDLLAWCNLMHAGMHNRLSKQYRTWAGAFTS